MSIPSKPVLLTGASGNLGRMLARELGARGWTLRLTDLAPFPDPLPEKASFTRMDLSDGVALLKLAELDVPQALVRGETERMLEQARADMRQRGAKDADKLQIPAEIFTPQAERRVRLGLVVAELVRANNLQAKPEQLQSHIEEMSQSYENPSEVMRWYLSDRSRLGEVEALVVENNVTDFVLAQAKINERKLGFDELMSA